MKGKRSLWLGGTLVIALGAAVGLLRGCGERGDRTGPAAESAQGGTSEGGSAKSGSAAVLIASGGQDGASKLPRSEGRVPDGRPASGIKVAQPVPGKPGFVFSPFNNRLVDVQGLPPGTLVQDPSDPDTSKIFRLPENPDAAEETGEEREGGE